MKIIEKENRKYYQCEECGHIYETEELANKCEEWCKEHRSCNLEIVKESVNIENKTNLKQLLLGILIGGVFIFVLANLKVPSIPAKFSKNSINKNLVSQIVNQVLPSEGFKTRLVLGDVVKKMIDCGVIDLEKMKKLYNGKIPEYIQKLINTQTMQTSNIDADSADLTQTGQNKISAKSAFHSASSAFLYFIEGHIPVGAIEKLLNEKPEIDGIALPEMPSGYPGMQGFKLSPFKIRSIKNGQDKGIFMEI
jgi:hypothetical protein